MSLKLVSLFALVLCLIPNESNVSAKFFSFNKSCIFPLTCSSQEATIFTTDGTYCYVYRNSCHLRKENCHRRRNSRPQLYPITNTECLTRCTEICSTQYVPVCGEYRGVLTTYTNDCVLLTTACRTGQSIRKIRNGECQTI